MFFALSLVQLRLPVRTITAKTTDLVVERVFLPRGSSVDLIFPDRKGFFFVAEPAEYSVVVAKFCTSMTDPACHWYPTKTHGIFAVGHWMCIARVTAESTGEFIVTVGYLSRECCDAVCTLSARWNLPHWLVEFTECFISASADLPVTLSISPLSSRRVFIVGHSPERRQVWDYTDGAAKARKLSALRFVNFKSKSYIVTAPYGENLISSTTQNEAFFGMMYDEDSPENPFVQYNSSHIERLKYAKERPVWL